MISRAKISFFLCGICFILCFACNSDKSDTTVNLTGQQGSDAEKNGWEIDYWLPKEHYSDTVSDKRKTQVLKISSDTLTRDRWFKKVLVNPYSEYEITGFVKTENVKGENANAGAGFRLGNMEFSGDTIFRGTTAWTPIDFKFNSGGDDSFMIEALLGKNGRASGKFLFSDLELKELSRKELNPEVRINIAKPKDSISPYMYGQFIEHMGKSIYGGLWAEMLHDRKFFYKPGTKNSSWKINTDTLKVKIDSTHTYSKGSIPDFEINDSLIIEQPDLTIQHKKYEGRVTFKATPGIKEISIALLDNGEIIDQKELKITSQGYQKIQFELESDKLIDSARFKISFFGIGELKLVAASLMPSDNIEGFRPDVIKLMKQLNSPVYRWPGGNFVSGYNWEDGLGDPDTRPTRYERAWKGLEYNDVGIDEFMKLCKILGAEANIAVNTGLGTAEMAANEVEYVNGSSDSKMGKIRSENGHPEAYGVRLWAVGNEMFGDWQLGHMTIEDYVKKHNKVAQAMWDKDPDIDLIAVGHPGKWNDMMYENCADYMTYISEHFYRQDWHAGGLLTHVKQIPDAIREIANVHRKARKEIPELKDKNIKIALDEWNYWYGPHVYGLLGTRYFLKDALGIAAGINEFSRQSDIYYMANYAQTINVIGAIKVTDTTSWMEGTGMVLSLYRKQFGEIPVEITGSPEPLDVAATLDGKGNLTISVINATLDSYSLKLNGIQDQLQTEAGMWYLITGDDPSVYNGEENKHRIELSEENFSLKNNTLEIPSKSAGIYSFPLKKIISNENYQ